MQEERIFFLKNAIKENPEEPFYRHALAMEYIEKRPDEAERLLRYVLEIFPDYLPTYYMAANLYFNIGDHKKAKAIFETGILLATAQKNEKAIRELKGSYMIFKDETEDD